MSRTILVTGASGYIGGRLVPELLDAGFDVRCFARTPGKLQDRPWRDRVEVVGGDVLDPVSLDAAMEGVSAAYYLVHSMDGEGDFRQRDRDAAATFREAAERARLDRIVYLGGLGSDTAGDADLSEHLRSRHEVGRILADGEVAVTELRAAIIIGSGSASFEMLRNLVEVLPAMVTPRWVETRCQPIAIRDILHYLVAVLDEPAAAGEVIEVGGPDVMTYRDLMQTYAEVAGLRRRLIVPVPVLSPALSSLWVGVVTPLPTGLARPLVESLVNEVVVTDGLAHELFDHDDLPFREAVALALQRVEDLDVATTWANAELSRRPRPSPRGDATRDRRAEPAPEDPSWSGGTLYSDERTAVSTASPELLFETVCAIGGDRGYHAADLLWEVRGLIDKVLGGTGVRRGRRHPEQLRLGDAVDFWRVEALEPPSLLRLRAEMRVPGDAWLEFRVVASKDGSRLVQRARFHPLGLWGRIYWLAMTPFHAAIFPRMATRLAEAAEVEAMHRERAAAAGTSGPSTATVTPAGPRS